MKVPPRLEIRKIIDFLGLMLTAVMRKVRCTANCPSMEAKA